MNSGNKVCGGVEYINSRVEGQNRKRPGGMKDMKKKKGVNVLYTGANSITEVDGKTAEESEMELKKK